MDTQTKNKSGFANNFWVQMAALVIVVVVLALLWQILSRNAAQGIPKSAFQ